ncbi:MAG: ribosome recycling factor [Alphaproteobacteria bacterium]
MANFDNIEKDIKKRMTGAAESLSHEFSGLRTGRASVALLDPIKVNVWGQDMPINQVASVSTPEARLITVQVWDKSNVDAVEKAIRESNLGLNPASDGQTIRLPIPPLNEERRVELTKVARGYTEEARIAVRNIRRHAMDEIKKLEKSGDISEDEMHNWQDDVQKITDDSIKKLDELLEKKEQEIMQV